MSGARIVWRIALATLREAWRGGLPAQLAAVLLAACLLAWFARQVALQDAAGFAYAWAAAFVRLGDAIALAAAVCFSVARAWADRQIEYAVAAPLPRPLWLLGLWCGWLLAAAGLALASALALALLAPSPQAAALWGCGLAMELMLVAAVALWLVLGLRHGAAALLATLGFLALARSAAALVLIAGARDGPGGWSAGLVRALHAMLPDLSRWLSLDSPAALPGVLGEAILYLTLLYALAVVDLYRRRF